VLLRPRDELLPVTATVPDDRRRRRSSSPHQVLEALAVYRPLTSAARDVARARRNAPAVLIVPGGLAHLRRERGGGYKPSSRIIAMVRITFGIWWRGSAVRT
jgi:hypothetical protein